MEIKLPKNHGIGGRNSQFSLALAKAIEGMEGVTALSADTDGIDGIEDNAGAYVSEETLKKASIKKINPMSYLNANNSYEFFEKIDDLIFTSPTLTNVNDFRAVLVQP